MKNLLAHVHLKDAVMDRAAESKGYVPFGEGGVDLLSHIKRLKFDEYAGYLSIETHMSRDKVKNTFKCWKNLQTFLKEINEKVE